MQALVAFLLIWILELSRSNLNANFETRAFYNVLSLSILVLIAVSLLLQNNRKLVSLENRIESLFSHKFGWGIYILDGLVVAIALLFSVKSALLIYSHPIYCQSADMLPMVRQAGEIFLAGGNPFQATYCPWGLPFTYLPMLLTSYLPVIALKIDIRFLSLLSFVLLVLLIYNYHKRKGHPLRAFLLAVVFFSSGLFPFFLLSVQTFPFLLLLFISWRSGLGAGNDAFFLQTMPGRIRNGVAAFLFQMQH